MPSSQIALWLMDMNEAQQSVQTAPGGFALPADLAVALAVAMAVAVAAVTTW
jgi:hypothetical protein